MIIKYTRFMFKLYIYTQPKAGASSAAFGFNRMLKLMRDGACSL